MITKTRFTRIALSIIIFGLVIAFIPTSAQDSFNQPISFNDVTMGEISLSRVLSKYTFSGNAGDNVYLRTQSLTPNFALEYNLIDANNQTVAKGTNINGQPGSLSIVELPSTGDFTIQIQSANGVAGQYAMTIEPAPAVEMPSLPMGELVQANAQSVSSRNYSLDTMPEGSTFLMFESLMNNNNLALTIMNPDTNEIVAMFRPDVSGLCMRLAPNVRNQQLIVEPSDETEKQDYQMLLWHSDDPNLACPSNIFDADASQATADISLDQSNSVSVTPLGAQSINLRSAPTTESSIVEVLNPGSDVNVIGTTPNGYWLIVDTGDTIAWVYSAIVSPVDGTLDNLPVINVTGAVEDYALVNTNIGGESGNPSLLDIDASNSDTTNTTGSLAVNGNTLIDANTDTTSNTPVNVNVNNDAVNTVNNAVNEASNTVNETVNEASNAVNEAVNETTNTVTKTVTSILGS